MTLTGGTVRSYGGLDLFRPFAALLVVAVHTGPLLSFHVTANYAITDILARLAVPFFFTVTGLFLVPAVQTQGRCALRPFLLKISFLYGISTLLYLPVKAYSGYFSQESPPLTLLRDIVFDGTFFHLWYFPAILLGACIVYLFVQKLNLRAALFICAGLYLFGLLGDSYFGLSSMVPPLNALYSVLFSIFDQTRNGLFFAPLFLVLGGLLSYREPRRKPCVYAAVLFLSLVLLLAEGFIMKKFSLARFDAMYLMLPFCTYALVQCLRSLPLSGIPQLRMLSTVVYVVHPLCIIGVRGVAKMSGLTSLLVDNSLFHFLSVSISACLISIPFIYYQRKKHSSKRRIETHRRAWIELDSDALRHNINELTHLLPEQCALMAVVKADAYGHGALEVAQLCGKAGISAFAVAAAEEGAWLRKHGVSGEILVLGYSGPEVVPLLERYKLTQTVISAEHARTLNSIGHHIKVHIKVDSGMHRLGIGWDDPAGLRAVYACPQLQIEGLFTHLASAETLEVDDINRTQEQVRRFYQVVNELQNEGFPTGKIHVQSTYGLLNYGGLPCSYVRVGLALYGLLSNPGDHTKLSPDLRPILSLRAKVAEVHMLETGDSAGYDGAFVAMRPSRVALVTIGYADGYPRNLSMGKGAVLIHGQPAPVAGLICMDQLLVDVTDIPGVAMGDIVTLIGQDGDAVITAGQLAWSSGTITNELLSRLGARLERLIC